MNFNEEEVKEIFDEEGAKIADNVTCDFLPFFPQTKSI